MTLSPLLNDECYKQSLIEDLVCLDSDDGSLQEELDHWPHSLLVPKYVRLDYSLANRPNSRACCEQSWNRGWSQPRTQVHLQVRSGVKVVQYNWEWCCLDRVQKRTMKYRMYPQLRRQIKAESVILNFSINTERPQPLIVQFVTWLSSLVVPS